jgi:hypothetical protein
MSDKSEPVTGNRSTAMLYPQYKPKPATTLSVICNERAALSRADTSFAQRELRQIPSAIDAPRYLPLLAVHAEVAFPPPLLQLGDQNVITNTHQARSISTHKHQNNESILASLPLGIILRTLHAAIQRLPANRPTREIGKPEDLKSTSPWDGAESASWPPIFLWAREPPLVGLARFHERCLKSGLNGLI